MSGSATALRPWGDLVRTDHTQAAAEIAGLVSASTAGIGVAASIDDAAVLELFTKKTAATLDYAVDFKPRPALTSTAQKIDDTSREKISFLASLPHGDVPVRPARRRVGRSPHLDRTASDDAGEVTANQRMRVGLVSKLVRSVEQCAPHYLNSGTVLEHAQGSTASHKSASKPTCGGSAAAHGAASLRWKGDWRRQVPTTLHCA